MPEAGDRIQLALGQAPFEQPVQTAPFVAIAARYATQPALAAPLTDVTLFAGFGACADCFWWIEPTPLSARAAIEGLKATAASAIV